jgi:PhnB protein
MPARIPEGFHAVTPGLTVRDAAKAIDFYKRAFGAVELYRMSAPGGKIGHAEIKIGDSIIMLSDEFPMGARSPQSAGGTTVTLHLYVQDVDAAFKQAVGAGAKADMPPTDMFWGDRYGQLTDPFGHSWGLATHVKDVSPEEMQKGADEAFSRMQTQHG